MKTHNGKINDGKFGIAQNDTFATENTIKVTLANGEVKDVKINNPKTDVKIQGELTPGKPVDLKISLDNINLPFSELDKIQKAQAPVMNNSTKEVENLNFSRKGDVLAASVPTDIVKTTVHYDVLALVILFGMTMFASQKIMMATNNTQNLDPAQQAMQDSMANIMPIMITGMFVFFPIPAGVLLYMIVSNIIQVGQTVIINKQIEAEEAQKSNVVSDNAILNAKKVNAKKVETAKEQVSE
jgi:membrane protein insertase Oxa1/YidC/SpoIIIJ